MFNHTIPESFCAGAEAAYRIGLLFTHKNGDFFPISVTERSCAEPTISKVESHISVKFSGYTVNSLQDGHLWDRH